MRYRGAIACEWAVVLRVAVRPMVYFGSVRGTREVKLQHAEVCTRAAETHECARQCGRVHNSARVVANYWLGATQMAKLCFCYAC